jgi:UDP-N-acetylmuramoylalanine--D-glutamate ligase
VITAGAWAGRHYAVYGLARSGLASVKALVASGARVTAWDEREQARAQAVGAELLDLNTADLRQFDSLVLSPGVPLNTHPIAAAAREAGIEIIGDIELFARARPELPRHKVVGITGTNGKSTTTALVHHILQTAGVPSTMGGNIGLPILAQDPLPEGGVYVLELSSFQIDLTHSLDCDVAVLLNITPDHLDRYESFEAYAASKARLFAMQSAGGEAIVDYRAEADEDVLDDAEDPFITFIDDVLLEAGDWPSLQGPHNLQNARAALAACVAAGVEQSAIMEALRTYPGLPHRMERVGEKNGVLFVNDSKATNPTATAPALAAFPAIRWILGGRAKSDRLDECASHFGHVRGAYTIGEAGPAFARILRDSMPVTECGDLATAVAKAAADAQPGETMLLSPACASYDQFTDFEARGDAFRRLVGDL